jgi:bifunctional non-homologous end joining protein LigD
MPSTSSDRLTTYSEKRDASKTPEPFGGESSTEGRLFVIQKHAATRLHYDLRLEHEGVLMSWAVPQGISLDPEVKRFAAQTEDHPLDYAEFEGVIPAGEYGAGPMIVWDRGSLEFIEDPNHGMDTGKLLFDLQGYKIRGRFTLVQMKNSKEWLLIKKPDPWARSGDEADTFDESSILSGRTVENVGDGAGVSTAVDALLDSLDAPQLESGAPAIEPMLAETSDAPFSRSGWIFEIKYDGYRLIAHKADELVALKYRSGRDATDTFPEIVASVASLPIDSAVIDGEVVVLDGDGKPSFSRLQKRGLLTNRFEVAAAAIELPATFFAFDLITCNGRDLRALPLTERKRALALLTPTVGPVRFSDHVEEKGVDMYEGAKALGLEGIMAKRADSAYVSRRSDDWYKMRIEHTATFAIVGFTQPDGSRTGFGALHLAARSAGVLSYAGRVGTGFDDATLTRIHSDLTGLPPLSSHVDGLPDDSSSTWVEPELFASVQYREVTPAGSLRHPVFIALKADADIGDVAEIDVAVDTDQTPPPESENESKDTSVRTSNLDKVFWPVEGYTKGDLISYYDAIADHLLPYLIDRPLVTVRYPDGIDGKSFYQKNAPDFVPDTIRTEWIASSDDERGNRYFVAENPDALRYIINLGAIPLHIWASRVTTIEQPDWCILDLDPKTAPFSSVITVAKRIKELLDEIGLASYPKTSGQSGLHILIPMGATYGFTQQKLLGEIVARIVEGYLPDIATTNRMPSTRGDRVYIDFVQNGRSKLIAAPYAARPVPGATVSAPLRWSEVNSKLDPRRFTIKSLPARLARMKGDPLLPVLTDAPDVSASLTALASILS